MKNGKCLLLGRVKNSEKLSVPRCGISLSRRVESQQEQLENEFNYGKKVKISTLESAKFAFPTPSQVSGKASFPLDELNVLCLGAISTGKRCCIN